MSDAGLRCLRYMHDVEYHTACYLRDLLLTPAHRDPDVTAFLACWAYEELWHGEALRTVLERHGEVAGPARSAAVRARRARLDSLRVLAHFAAGRLVGSSLVALVVSWGAVNEWTTQAGYARLAATEDHPVLSALLHRIMKQEGRHIDYYAAEAERRLSASRAARRLTRHALARLWQPVGSGVMERPEVAHLVGHLFGSPEGLALARRVDRRVDRLPGLDGLGLMTGAVTRHAPQAPAGRPPAQRAVAQPAGELVSTS